jgi:hypothetical protein
MLPFTVIDLVPPEVVAQWVKYLRRYVINATIGPMKLNVGMTCSLPFCVLFSEYPTIAFKASTQQQRSNIGHSKLKAPGVSMKPAIPTPGPNGAPVAAGATAAAPVTARLDRNTVHSTCP